MRNYKTEQKLITAEVNYLDTPPPPKQQYYIDIVKRQLDEMNCQEITITYKPKLQLTTDTTLKLITEGLLQNIIEGKATMICLHEYSDGGLFHYHCILSGAPKRIISTIRKQLTLHIGTVHIKTITYLESYIRYMTKQTIEPEYDNELNIFIN